MKRLTIPLGAVAVLVAGPLLADTPPPPNALPLSEIILMVEATGEVDWIKEVEWDDDGYWEVEYVSTDGRSAEFRMDPVSGERR